MRAPHAELLAAQKTGAITPLVKLDIDNGSYTYYKGTLLRGEYSEQVYDHYAELTLENRDGAFDDLDFKGLLATLSFGATTAGGDKYSAVAPLWVLRQSFDSAPNQKYLYLYMVGLPNLLLEDRASVNYQPASTDTKTVKDIFNAVANGQTPMYPVWQASTTYTKSTVVRKVSSNGYAYECTVGGDSGGSEPEWSTTLGATFVDNDARWLCIGRDNPYAHCTALTVTWDSEDSLIDSYIPKDAFTVYKGASRLGTLRQLVDYTKCIMRFEADGEIHIRVPVVSGGSYDETYDFDTGGRHPFFSKAYRQALVIPNKVQVDSRVGDSPVYTGVATSAASYALINKWQFVSTFLASDAQAVSLAGAIIAKAEMSTDGGSVYAKIMNTAQELYDYILVEDTRQGDSRAGNVGAIVRRFNVPTGQFDMTLTFGAWLSIRQEINNLEAYPSGFGSGVNFPRLTVGDLDATNITADNLDMTSVTLDTIGDGTEYKRMLAVHLDAGVFQMTDDVSFDAGFDPRHKFDKNNDDFDDIPEGTTYQRVLATQISAGKIELSDALDYSIGYNPSDKTRTFIDEPTTPYALGDLWSEDGIIKRCNTGLDEGAYNAAHWTTINIDDIANGSVYSRVATASLTAEGLVLLDQVSTGTHGLVKATDISSGHIKLSTVVADGATEIFTTSEQTKLAGVEALADVTGTSQASTVAALTGLDLDDLANGSTYGRVALTDISAGHILLATVIEDGTHKVYSGTEQTKLGGVATGADVTGANQSLTVASLSGLDVDDLADGTTYKRIRATSLSSGNILLSSNVVVSGEWYNESGVEIDSVHGINIYGENNALTTRATKTGTIQCSVNSSGAITAGAGAVILDASGITVAGQYINFNHVDGETTTTKGSIYADAEGFKVLSGSPHDLIVQGYPIRMQGDTDPYTANTNDLGASAAWRNIHGTPVLRTYAGVFAPIVAGQLCYMGDDTGHLSVYDTGTWQYTYDHSHP